MGRAVDRRGRRRCLHAIRRGRAVEQPQQAQHRQFTPGLFAVVVEPFLIRRDGSEGVVGMKAGVAGDPVFGFGEVDPIPAANVSVMSPHEILADNLQRQSVAVHVLDLGSEFLRMPRREWLRKLKRARGQRPDSTQLKKRLVTWRE